MKASKQERKTFWRPTNLIIVIAIIFFVGLPLMAVMAVMEMPGIAQQRIDSLNHPTADLICIENCARMHVIYPSNTIRVYENQVTGNRCYRVITSKSISCESYEVTK